MNWSHDHKRIWNCTDTQVSLALCLYLSSEKFNIFVAWGALSRSLSLFPIPLLCLFFFVYFQSKIQPKNEEEVRIKKLIISVVIPLLFILGQCCFSFFLDSHIWDHKKAVIMLESTFFLVILNLKMMMLKMCEFRF